MRNGHIIGLQLLNRLKQDFKGGIRMKNYCGWILEQLMCIILGSFVTIALISILLMVYKSLTFNIIEAYKEQINYSIEINKILTEGDTYYD